MKGLRSEERTVNHLDDELTGEHETVARKRQNRCRRGLLSARRSLFTPYVALSPGELDELPVLNLQEQVVALQAAIG